MDVRSKIGAYVRSGLAVEIEDKDDIFDLGLVDSLFALQLVNFVEQAFEISVDGADLDISNFCSIDALTNFVSRNN
jgi:methoxymalonate biosynthesis acyl carrier protein